MGGSSGGGTSTTVQKADPWAESQPYLKDVMSKAQSVYGQSQGNQYFPGSTVVPFSNETNQALGSISTRARQGSPLIGAAQGELQKTISGGYLDPTKNPAYATMADDVTNRVQSQFGAAGRTGSGANAGALARGITEGGAGLYDQERQRQMQAQLFAPTMANQDYYDASMLANVGQQKETLSSNYITDAMNRYNFNQNLPWDNLNKYTAVVNGYGGLGGTNTVTQPMGSSNSAASGFGGAMSGAALGNQIYPGGWGAGIGAIGGGLFGSFG